MSFFVCEIIVLKKIRIHVAYRMAKMQEERSATSAEVCGLELVRYRCLNAVFCLFCIYIVKFDSNDVVEFPSLFFVHRGNHATGWRNIFRQSMLSRWLRNSSTRLVFSTVCSRCQHKNKHAREDGKIESPQNCQRARLTAIKRVDIRLAELNSNLIAATKTT